MGAVCRPTLVIVGASARAAAQSAWRAGLQPRAADMFADLDLRRLTGARIVPNYPAGLVSRCRKFEEGPWMYTGALENYPQLVEELAAERPLHGNDSTVLRRVRDPWQLAAAAQRAGWRFPEIRHLHSENVDAADERWLCKPLRSAGGNQIRWLDASLLVGTNGDGGSSNGYLQRFIPGQSESAAFVAAQGRAVLLGTSRQLIGCRWLGATGFQYGGSLGPLPLTSNDERSLVELGNQLALEFNLVGLFGVDYVASGDGHYVLEVNPRYTASMEILERSTRFSMVAAHMRACQLGILPDARPGSDGRIWGKAIVYARRGTWVARRFFAWVERANRRLDWPVVADIPTFGQWIPTGRPVTTVFAAGATACQVLCGLKRRAKIVHELLDA